jgi:hypothetical protein
LQCGLAVVNGTEDVSGINKYAMMVCLIGKREAGDHRKDFHHQKRLQNVAPAFAPVVVHRSVLVTGLSESERFLEVPGDSL